MEPSFPFGNLKGLGTKSHPAQVFQSLYIKLKDSGSKFVGIYSFLQPMPLIIDPELIKQILIKDFSNFDDRGLYYNEKDDPLSAHLLAVEGNDIIIK